MKYFFSSLLIIVIALAGCVDLPTVEETECSIDSDCSDYGDNFICDANGDCTACPLPSCVAPPKGCHYEQDDSARCPNCGTLKCIPTETPPTCNDNKKKW